MGARQGLWTGERSTGRGKEVKGKTRGLSAHESYLSLCRGTQARLFDTLDPPSEDFVRPEQLLNT